VYLFRQIEADKLSEQSGGLLDPSWGLTEVHEDVGVLLLSVEDVLHPLELGFDAVVVLVTLNRL
jgi:hypothetical protein